MILPTPKYKTVSPESVTTWYEAGSANEFPTDGGLCIQYEDLQIAVFNFSRRNEWYATQNLCPHKNQMILSRGMIGSEGQEPKMACPFHKNTFSLKSGKNINGNECALATYPVKVMDGKVYVGVA
jgi:nitrite reductase (NADH) small subunit